MAIKGSVYVITHIRSNDSYVVGVHDTKASAMKQANKFIKSLKLRWYSNSDESCHADSIDPDGENELSIIKWVVESCASQEKAAEEESEEEQAN
jgi:hypothetical protein